MGAECDEIVTEVALIPIDNKETGVAPTEFALINARPESLAGL